MNKITVIVVLGFVMTLDIGTAFAKNQAEIVNVDNFVRAETAAQFDRMVKMAGGSNKWSHFREPTPLDKQSVIRMNRDTLYSFAIVDISKGATLTIPDSGKRYMSVMVVNQNHYINKVFHKAGTYKLAMKEFNTPYVLLAARTLVNASDPSDIKAANALQDQLKIKSVSSKPYKHIDYDKASYEKTYKLLLELSKGMSSTNKMFGSMEDVDPIRHLLGAAYGWGGLPEKEAYYLTVEPSLPLGKYQLTVKDVPVDGFWSISVYNKNGFFEKNKFNSYSINNITATPNKNGSFTVNFGGCEDKRINCLPISQGWNYTVRMYLPHQEVLDSKWTFPKPELLK